MGSPPSEYTLKHCIEKFFTVQDFRATCSCPEKQSVLWIHCIEYIFFIIQGFWATYPCREKHSCPKIFTCTEIFFIIQDFWATCPCPEKQSVPWIHSIAYIFFIIQDFLATCPCREKQSCTEIFHCIEIFFITQDFWSTCACPENRVCSENFQAGGCRPPASYTYGFASTRTKCPEYANLEKCRRGRLARGRIPIIKFGPTCKNFGHFCFSTTLSRLIYTLTDFVRKKIGCTFYTQTSLNIQYITIP